jgi:hypothetical protein
MQAKMGLLGSMAIGTLNQDITPYGELDKMIDNNGIERLGGITNQHLTTGTLPSSASIPTPSGKIISLVGTGDTRTVQVDGVSVGAVSAYGVAERGEFQGYLDACASQDGEGVVLTITVTGGTVTYREHSIDGTVLNSRDIVFTNLVDVLPIATSISIVKSATIAWADSLELMVRLESVVSIIKESATGITISDAIQYPSTNGSTTGYNCIGVYEGQLIVAVGIGISSYDGTAWKFSDGTGSGSGVFAKDADAIVINPISAIAVFRGALVVGSQTGEIASYKNGVWTKYNGIGLCNNRTVLGAVGINALCNLNDNFLVVAGNTGKVGSWNGTAWTNFNAAGTGVTVLANNQTVIGTSDILQAISHNGVICTFSGYTGRIGSWNGTAWTNYNAVGTGVSVLANNGTVAGANIIQCSVVYGSKIMFAAADGSGNQLVGYYETSNNTWVNYNAPGSGSTIPAYNTNTLLGSFSTPRSMVVRDSNLFFIGSTGSVAYWDGSAWHLTGEIGNPLTKRVVGSPSTSITNYASVLYNGQISVGALNSILSDSIGTWYLGSPSTTYVGMFTNSSTNNQIYAYRYDANNYLVMIQGNSIENAYIINTSTDPYTIKQNVARYAVPQTQAGKTRHVLTGTQTGSGQLKNLSYVGYNDFSTFTNTQVFTVFGVSALPAETTSTLGYGYADVWSTAGGGTVINPLVLYPSPFSQLQEYRIFTANTNTRIGMYGKLTNLYGLASPKPYEIRIGQVNGTQAFVSVAMLDGSPVDALGTLITAVGEFDETYLPDVSELTTGTVIMYRYNDKFFVARIGVPTLPLEQVDDNLVQINTIAPANLYNDDTGLLMVSNCDYNNRMIFESSVAPAVVAVNCASKFYSAFSNSVDTGEKQVYITGLSASNIIIPGARLPLINANVTGYGINTYIAGAYSFTTLGNLAEVVDAEKVDTLYLRDSTLPVPIGMDYQAGSASYNGETIFLDEGRNTYTIGNDLQGDYQSFQLYGQIYLVDEFYIYLAEINNGVFTGQNKVAPKKGLRYIATSPNEAFFVSDFDNSLYSFNGGRALNKIQRFTNSERLNYGVWSEVENTLAMDQDSAIIYVRDSIITRVNKPANIGIGARYYNTANGLVMVDGTTFAQYSLEPKIGSTVVPLNVRTANYGVDNNTRSIIRDYVITLYAFTPQAMSVTLTVSCFDQDNWYEQVEQITLATNDFNGDKVAMIRIQPENQRVIASSLRIEVNKRVVVLNACVNFEPEVQASIRAGLSS